MKLVIGSDKSGFVLKESIRSYLESQGIEYMDIGTTNVDEPLPFYKVAPCAAKAIQNRKADLGVLICGTGMGMSQVANKYKGVRAACVESVYSARMCRAVNDSQIMCMGGWIIAPELGLDMCKTFLSTGFTEGLEDWRKTFLTNARDSFEELEDAIYTK